MNHQHTSPQPKQVPSPCVIPCDQVLRTGTAFPCLIEGMEFQPLSKQELLPCSPQEGSLKALIASNLMREDLALHLCLYPQDTALRSVYHLLGQKLHALQEAAEMDDQNRICIVDIPLYPLPDVGQDIDLAQRVVRFLRHTHSPLRLSALHGAIYAGLNDPTAALFGRLAMHNLRLGKLLAGFAVQLGEGFEDEDDLPIAHAADAPVQELMQAVLDGTLAAGAKLQGLAKRAQSTEAADLLHFAQVRMQVCTKRIVQVREMIW